MLVTNEHRPLNRQRRRRPAKRLTVFTFRRSQFQIQATGETIVSYRFMNSVSVTSDSGEIGSVTFREMDELLAKTETWMNLIQLEKLQDVLADIQMYIHVRPNIDLNISMYRLLIRLCRVADTCDKQSCESGKNIAKLAKLLCSLLIEIPDGDSFDKNFVKAIFKIVRCLIFSNLHEDAAEVCSYLQPGKLYNPQSETMNLLVKVLSLWRILVNNIYQSFTNESFDTETYNKLKSVITYEMKMIQIAHKSYTKHLIVQISEHLDRVSAIDKDKKYFDDFCKYILEYLSEVQLYLDKDEKYIIYHHILRIVCHVTVCRAVNTTDFESAIKTLDDLSNYFETLLAENEEYCQCFRQFQSLCRALLVPMENLVNDDAKSIENIIDCNLNIAQKYGHEVLKWNAFSIMEVVESICTYWKKCVDTDKRMLTHLLDTGILVELMNLFIHINVDEFYIKQERTNCKWCLGKCTIKRDLYNSIVMRCKFITLICEFPVKTLSKEVCAFGRKILERDMKSIIHEIKEGECKRWTQSWNTCRNLMYNVGLLSEHIYEESVYLFSFLYTCIFQVEGIKSSSADLENPENCENINFLALHRLSVVHYNNNMYRKAMTVCALNGLLTCNHSNTKAFHMWINIKKKAPEEIVNLTMLECLTRDKDEIKNELGFSIDTLKCDFITLCLREARNLLEEQITFTNGVTAVLQELRELQPSDQYAHTMQLLGYYLLGFNYDSSILKYHEQAIRDLKHDNKSNSVAILCLEANLRFFMFVEELHIMNKQTRMEMENAKFALCAPNLRELAETKSPNVVPAYTMINIKKDTNLMLYLQKSLKKWKQLFKCYFEEMVKDWEPKLILNILITAGEYARLYRYEDCEIEIWTLAYKLASEMDNYRIIYITSRCISLRQINYDWITTAKEYVVKYRDSDNKDIINIIAIFWISLADLYFECGKYDEAKQLLTEARNLTKMSFLAYKSVYLLSLDVIIRNNHFYDMQHEDYSLRIEENRYAMRSLNEDLLTKTWFTNQMTYLFNCDLIFTSAVNLSIRINSLLSFRGISPDLVLLLKTAQNLNAMMRTAELLKSLCYIDLSRLQLEDCEVKLQGLEHMLNIETFQLSMESKLKSVETSFPHLAVTPTKIADSVRDISQYDASPVLGKKVFDLPKFTLHTDCDCYKCINVSYQYMVFATTYIRAQLYASQNHITAALEHFYGAFEIRRKLFEEEKSVLPENWPRNEIGVKRLSWQIRFYITDYILLLINFGYFMKTKIASKQEDVSDIINLAINICCKYKLERHPVYKMAKELALDNEFQLVLESSDFNSKFMVPQPYEIDISDISHTKISIDPSVCVTPSAQNRPKKPVSVRRTKNPVISKLTEVNMNWRDDWSDDEDDDSSSLPATSSNRKFKSCINLVKKKILEEDLADEVAKLNCKTLKTSTEKAGTSLTNVSKTLQTKNSKLLSNNEDCGRRITRSSVRRNQKEKPS